MTDYSEALGEARKQQPSTIDTAKNLAKATTPVGFFSLLKNASLLKDLPFVVAFLAAGLKDLLDFTLIGSLPGIGTVLTIMCSICIGMMMLLAGMGGKGKVVKGVLQRMGMLGAGTIAEFIPGLNFFPVETVTVFVIYVMTLAGREGDDK